MHRLIETVEQTDELLRALIEGKQLEIHWGGIIGNGKLMVGRVRVPSSAHEDLRVTATKWRDEARRQLGVLGVEGGTKDEPDAEAERG